MSNSASVSAAIEEYDLRLRRRLAAVGIDIDPLHLPAEPLPEGGERCPG